MSNEHEKEYQSTNKLGTEERVDNTTKATQINRLALNPTTEIEIGKLLKMKVHVMNLQIMKQRPGDKIEKIKRTQLR